MHFFCFNASSVSSIFNGKIHEIEYSICYSKLQAIFGELHRKECSSSAFLY